MKYIATAAFVFSVFYAAAQPVNIKKAVDIAERHMHSVTGGRFKDTGAQRSESRFSPVFVSTAGDDTLFYVFNDTVNNCFVMVAADLRSRPILGYSFNGLFDASVEVPAFSNWMEERKREIAGIKKGKVRPEKDSGQLWDNLSSSLSEGSGTMAGVEPLLKTTWNQGCYYNMMCPADPAGPCGHTVTGCVATAMAQIMKYWNFPPVGTGSNSYDDETYGTQHADFGATIYRWNEMPAKLTGQNDAVATLMYHCGVSVNMSYGPSGSAASVSPIPMRNFFGYSPNARYVSRSDFSDTDWSDLMISELDLLRPVLYRGSSTTAGHAFILDGYQEPDYFHINWGWGGWDDAYYFLGSIEFNSGQGAIINLTPTDLPEAFDGFFLSKNRYSLFATPDSDSLTIFSSVPWTAAADQPWITVAPGSGGPGKRTVMITAGENNSGMPRSGTITISSPGYGDQIVRVDQTAKTAVTAGELKNIMGTALTTTTTLCLTGTIDARDFKTMRDEMPQLLNVDLRDVNIVTYSGTEGTASDGRATYPANTIPQRAFYYKDILASVNLPVTVTAVGDLAFYGCYGLKAIYLPSSVVMVGNYAFWGCQTMKILDIPASVTFIGHQAFSYCWALNSIFARSVNPPDLSSSSFVFYEVNKETCKLYVPSGSQSHYATADQWKDFLNVLEIPTLEGSPAEVGIGYTTGSTASIQIASNTTWNAFSDQPWLMVTPGSGNGNTTLLLTASGNPFKTVRTATITLTAEGVNPKTIGVTQLPNPLEAGFSASSVNNCPGSYVAFADLSPGKPLSWQWSFEGGSPSSSSVQNPVILYDQQGIFDVTLTVSDGTNSSTLTLNDYVNTRFQKISLEAVIFLEGALIDPSSSATYVQPMRTTLNGLGMLPGQTCDEGNIGYAPPGQPYKAEPWLYMGAEGNDFDPGTSLADGAVYSPTVVDWVLVSLRSGNPEDYAEQCRKAALLHKDGSIEMIAGYDCCVPDINASYFLMVEHRNHLPVMSHEPLLLVNGVLNYDFTAQQSYITEGSGMAGQKEANGIFFMFGGNGNQSTTEYSDTDINANDQSTWEKQNGQTGYRTGDYNMNGDTNSNDQIIWERNNGQTTSVPR